MFHVICLSFFAGDSKVYRFKSSGDDHQLLLCRRAFCVEQGFSESYLTRVINDERAPLQVAQFNCTITFNKGSVSWFKYMLPHVADHCPINNQIQLSKKDAKEYYDDFVSE